MGNVLSTDREFCNGAFFDLVDHPEELKRLLAQKQVEFSESSLAQIEKVLFFEMIPCDYEDTPHPCLPNPSYMRVYLARQHAEHFLGTIPEEQ